MQWCNIQLVGVWRQNISLQGPLASRQLPSTSSVRPFFSFPRFASSHPFASAFASFRSSNINGIIICFMLCGFVCFPLFFSSAYSLDCTGDGLPSSYLPCCSALPPLHSYFSALLFVSMSSASMLSSISLFSIAMGGVGGITLKGVGRRR